MIVLNGLTRCTVDCGLQLKYAAGVRQIKTQISDFFRVKFQILVKKLRVSGHGFYKF